MRYVHGGPSLRVGRVERRPGSKNRSAFLEMLKEKNFGEELVER
jgi:hypothetical protein